MFLFWEPILWNVTMIDLFLEGNIINFNMYILLGFIIFLIGFFGLLLYKDSLIFCLISVELMMVGLNYTLIFIGALLNNFFCQILFLIILTLTAAETAIGLSLVLLYHKLYLTTSLRFLKFFNF